jgi:hypothetical protein
MNGLKEINYLPSLVLFDIMKVGKFEINKLKKKIIKKKLKKTKLKKKKN